MQPQAAPRFYTVNLNITDSNGPLVLPYGPPGHIFVVMHSLIKMLTARVLGSGLASKDEHAHIVKLRFVCKSCVGRPDLDMNILRVLSVSFITDRRCCYMVQ